jgi:tetratricopeptide (TPR) repeat protein
MAHRLQISLDVPDDDATRQEPGYSSAMADALTRAYTLIKRQEYTQARELIAATHAWPVSSRQRMRAFYVTSLAAVGLHLARDALHDLDEAMDLAVLLEDLGSCALLASLSASVSGGLQQFRVGADFYGIALEALRILGADGGNRDSAFELEILVGLSGFEFLLGLYDMASGHLDDARRLVTAAPESRLLSAAIEWTTALILRWRGESDKALRLAMAASDAYAALNVPGAHARVQTVVADIALDLADAMALKHLPDASSAFIQMAGPYVTRALEIAHEANDVTDEAMALLTRVRYSRLARRHTPRVPVIKDVTETARKLGDIPLLGQAYTAMGHELQARGDIDAAIEMYQRALDVLKASDAVAMSVWPQRAKLLAEEMRRPRE